MRLGILSISILTLSTFTTNNVHATINNTNTNMNSNNNSNENITANNNDNNANLSSEQYNNSEIHTEANVDHNRSNYNKTYQLKNPKKTTYLVNRQGKIIQKLSPKKIYHTASLESYQSNLYKGQIPLSNFNNNLKASGYINIKDLKPAKTDKYYESKLARQIRQLFPDSIHDQSLQRRVDIAPTIESPDIGDYLSDVEGDMKSGLPLSQTIMNKYYGPKNFKAYEKMTDQQYKELFNKVANSSNQQIFPAIKKEIINQLKSNHQSLDDFNGYHIAVSVYPQNDKHYPYGFWILLNKPDNSSTS